MKLLSGTRRGIVYCCICCWLVLAASPASAQLAPRYAGFDHVKFFVADMERALGFYTRLFGAEVWKNNQAQQRYLRLGQSYLALEPQADARIEYICFGVENFNADRAQGWLDAQGIRWQDSAASPAGGGARELHVEDRNGIRTLLARHNTWEEIAGSVASREARPDPGPPIFEAYVIDEVFLTVTNLEVDSLFYSRLLDQTGVLQAGSLWYELGTARLRITQAPVGQTPGIAYFAVHVAYTDMEAAADAVFAAGGIIENILPNGFSFWDPDGIRVVVRSGDLY